MRRALLFYSIWPLGYHNPEAERKARALAARGWDVVYVTSIGIRNPRLTNLAKLGDRVGRKLLPGRFEAAEADEHLRTGSVLVAPPRQSRLVGRANRIWLEHQLRAMLDWDDAVAWVRWPTPELVDVLPSLRPAGIVYDCVDAYDHTPGISGRWADRFHAAERALVEQADVVVVPNQHLAERFLGMGARVEVIPHGVDLELFAQAVPRARGTAPVTIGFVGTLDYRLDLPVLRHVATARPEWQLRLVGPVQEGFDPAALADLPNVTVDPAVAFDRVGATLAEFDACLMPYVDHPVYHAMTPVKTLEIMAVGRPAVARPTLALEPYRELLYLAEQPPQFVDALDRALAEDSPERALRRRKAAELESWQLRVDELLNLAASL